MAALTLCKFMFVYGARGQTGMVACRIDLPTLLTSSLTLAVVIACIYTQNVIAARYLKLITVTVSNLHHLKLISIIILKNIPMDRVFVIGKK